MGLELNFVTGEMSTACLFRNFFSFHNPTAADSRLATNAYSSMKIKMSLAFRVSVRAPCREGDEITCVAN